MKEIVETTDGTFDTVLDGEIVETYQTIYAAVHHIRNLGWAGPIDVISGPFRFRME